MMADKWHAECIPCGWLELHDDQRGAIRAAEDHVYSAHRDTPAEVRGEKKIGHVQNRTVNDPGELNDQGNGLPVLPITDDGA
jgi:hypothetical protein